MAWEVRRNRRYYYRSHRIGKRVVKEYFGAGLAAHLASAEDDQRRREGEQLRYEVKLLEDKVERSAAPQDAIDVQASALMKAALRAAGYHQHERGEWRKRRVCTAE